MTKSEFKEIFRNAVSEEFAHIPSEESVEYTFSDSFTNKMERLIRRQKKFYWSFVNTGFKRVAVITVTVAGVLFASVVSVEAVRNPIVEFITEIVDGGRRYFFVGDTTNKITREYTMTYVPEGFEQVEKDNDKDSILTVYENDKGDMIRFHQCITDVLQYSIDSEHGEITTEMIGGNEVDIYERDIAIIAIWVEDAYFFLIDMLGDVDRDAVKKMIESVE